MEAIETERAKERMLAGKTLDPMVNLPQGPARDIIARTIGLGSGKQWEKLKFIAEKKPELLADTYKSRSLNSAYIEVKRYRVKNGLQPTKRQYHPHALCCFMSFGRREKARYIN